MTPLDRHRISNLCDQFSLLHDGELSPEEQQALERLIAEDENARRLYVRYTRLCAGLSWDFGGKRGARVPPAPPTPAETSSGAARWRRARRILMRPATFSLAVATLVLVLILIPLAFIAVPFYQSAGGAVRPVASTEKFVAQLTGVYNPQWAEGQIGTTRGAHLLAGQTWNLEAGLVEVAFRSGSIVTIEGPAVVEFLSSNGMRLSRGKLHARVPQQAVGFALDAPGVRLIDLGTEFRVDVDAPPSMRGEPASGANKSVVDVRVLDGAVEAQRAGAAPLRIAAGESLRFREDAAAEPLPAEAESFTRIELPQVEFFSERRSWLAAVEAVEPYPFTASNVALAAEVAQPPAVNAKLGPKVTFGARPTGLSCGFSVTALERGPRSGIGSAGRGLVFADEEGPRTWPQFKDALSIGDIDNFEDDDFEVRFTGPAAPTAVMIVIKHNDKVAGESLTVYSVDGEAIGRYSEIPLPDEQSCTFLGLTSSYPVGAIVFNEDAAGGDDIALSLLEIGRRSKDNRQDQ